MLVGQPGIATGDISVPEGELAVFGVRVNNAAAGSTLVLTLADGTAVNPAVSPDDYSRQVFEFSLDNGTTWTNYTGAIAVAAGNSVLQVRTSTVNDLLDEANETFTLGAALTSLGTTVSDSATATIVDNDTLPTIGGATASVSEEGLANGLPDTDGTPDSTNSASANGSLNIVRNGSAPLTVGLQTDNLPTALGETAVTWSLSTNGTVLTASAGADAVLRITLNGGNPAVASGAGTSVGYQVDLLRPIQHPTTSTEDAVTFNVGLRISDGANPIGSGALGVTIEDDSPRATPLTVLVSEPVPALVSGLQAGFVSPVGGSTANFGLTNNDTDAFNDVVAWGSNGRSSYAFVDNPQFVGAAGVPVSGTFRLGTFTHNNQTIDTGSSLTRVNLDVNFLVNGQTVSQTITLNHNETTNTSDPLASRDIISIAGGVLVREFTVAGQPFRLTVDGFRDANNALVTEVRTNENASTSFDLFARVESISAAPITGTVNPQFGADGAGTVIWDGAVLNTTTGEATIANALGTFVGRSDGTFRFTPALNANVRDDTNISFNYTVRDRDGDVTNSTLTVTMRDGSEPVAVNDSATASEGNWDIDSATNRTVQVLQPESWSTTTTSTTRVTGTWAIDPQTNGVEVSNQTPTFTFAANAANPATVRFDIDVDGHRSGDVVRVELVNTTTSTVVDSRTFSNSANNQTFSVTTGGTYFLRLVGDDNTSSGNLKAYLDDLQVTSRTFTPARWVTQSVATPNMLWVAGLVAVGNVLANDDVGIEGAVVSQVTVASTVATVEATGNTLIVGQFGTLSINAQGAYTYTPNQRDNPNGAQDVFSYTIRQPDGDTATANLTVNLTNFTYSAAATDGAQLVGGGDGNDTLGGLGGNDVVYGGAGNDALDGGAGNDLLLGGIGNDTLTGGLGADVFAWRLGDQGSTGTPARDVITDFTPGQGDALDLRDLLQGESATNLGNYLRFDTEGTKLVLLVDHDGGTGTFEATQHIVFDNFADRAALAQALGMSGTPNDADILTRLREGGHLRTD